MACCVLGSVTVGCSNGEAQPIERSAAEPVLVGRSPGGDTTVQLGPARSMIEPAANLDDAGRSRFHAGKALANQPWVRAPTLTDARDGLGPLYNARSCLACHIKGGRGVGLSGDGPLFASLVRVSLPGRGPHGEPIPDPVYGTQIQPQSTSLSDEVGKSIAGDEGPPPEAEPSIAWQPVPYAYPDGTKVELRRPELVLGVLGYGPLDPYARVGIRHAPPLPGMGLLELIELRDLQSRADPDDVDGDGISGRLNLVWDPERERERPGRFGWKANQPSVRVQVAAAFAGDLGISNPVFPDQPCTDRQRACLDAPTGNDADGFELPESLLDEVVFFTMSIGVVERRKPGHDKVVRGGELFAAAGCSDCHTPHYVTGVDPDFPHLSNQDAWPYTDLLLHDMGTALADGREDHLATGSEWRTPPLWGVGLARAMTERVGLLHDGRARSVEEAILWHAGEAAASRERFAGLRAEDRNALIAFVRSL